MSPPPTRESAVVVVGAGPTGLSAALALRARGLPVTLLEADPEDRVRPGSRAIYVHGASLKLLERVRPGLGWSLARRGLIWPTRRTTYRGRDVFTKSYPPPKPDVMPHFSSLPQLVAEGLLLDACRAVGVEIIWEAALDELEVDDEGVSLTARDGRRWRASYVVAADGARSVSRKRVGVEMEGSRSNNSFIVVDVAEDDDDPLPLERVFHYEHPAVAGRNVLLVPFKGGWRADLQCLASDDPVRWSEGPGLRRWIGAMLGPRYAERVTWVSTYVFMQVLAARFTDRGRRVLLTGEAAHLFAPFGARGMNSGMADAEAAAAAIDQALDASDPSDAVAAVEDFARARRSAAEWNRACSGAALDHLQASTSTRRAKRRAAALASAVWPRAGKWLDEAPYGPRTPPPGAGQKY